MPAEESVRPRWRRGLKDPARERPGPRPESLRDPLRDPAFCPFGLCEVTEEPVDGVLCALELGLKLAGVGPDSGLTGVLDAALLWPGDDS